MLGCTVRQVQFQRVGEHRIGLPGSRNMPCAFRYASTSAMRCSVAAGQAQIVQRDLVDREEAAGRAVFRRHVADGGAVRQAEIVQAGAEEFDELADHALRAAASA